MDARKKTILASSLIFLWVGLAVWQWGLLQEPVHVPLTNVTGRPSVGQHVEKSIMGLRVNLDLLPSTGLQSRTNFTVSRNIFSAPGPAGTLATEIGPAFLGQPGAASAEPLAEQEGEWESEQYRYLGFLRMGEGRRGNMDIAVLRKDDEVLVLKVGDRVDDHLILKAINSESVTIRNIGTHVDQTVQLSRESSEEPSEEPKGEE